MKKQVWMIWSCLALAALLFTACGHGPESDLPREIDICLEGYAIEDGMLTFTQEDPEGNKTSQEYGSLRVMGVPGETISDALAYWNYSDLTPVKEADVFEGWMECEYDVAKGDYVIVSEKLLSMKELLATTVPDRVVTYVAKWQSIPTEDYFTLHPEDYRAESSFAFVGNGGSLILREEDGTEYTTPTSTYWLDGGKSLQEVMASNTGVTLLGAQKDGAEFLGWTVYQAEELFWGDESVYEEGLICIAFDQDTVGRSFVMLRNAQQLEQTMSTQALLEIVCYGENYLAVATWG